jgi:ech hydrogenase subunit E
MSKALMPFGPFHEFMHETLGLTLEFSAGKVISAVPSVGYLRRGIEQYMTGLNCDDALPVMEKICRRCGYSYLLAFCRAIEEINEITIPKRARVARMIVSELTKSHGQLESMIWTFDTLGCDKAKEIVQNVTEKTMELIEPITGSRYMSMFSIPGGISHDIEKEKLLNLQVGAKEIAEDLRDLDFYLYADPITKSRLKDCGRLTLRRAAAHGVTGIAAKASGLEDDAREADEDYEGFGYEMKTASEGDSYARLKLRVEEISMSMEIISNAVISMPDGPIMGKIPETDGLRQGEAAVVFEQAGGKALLYLRLNAGGEIARFAIRSSTAANLNTAVGILTGAEIQDVPVILSTMDICMHCFEK